MFIQSMVKMGYHIRSIFAKLEAHTRADAVRRARELGLFHSDF